MPLIVATGSNIGDGPGFLNKARHELSKTFDLVASSRIYKSEPVDFFDQDDFFNQVLEFKTPTDLDISQSFLIMRKVEASIGEPKTIYKGPRQIDIDLIFWDRQQIKQPELTIPHPSWRERSFVVLPLQELPAALYYREWLTDPFEFNGESRPINA